MPTARFAVDEKERLAELSRYDILDTPQEETFDGITYLAAHTFKAPVSLISLVDECRLWFKSRYGLNVTELPREQAFCSRAICQNEPFIVPDATVDPLFKNTPLVRQEPNIRFYAAAPLISSRGYKLGVLCVIDYVPREVPSEQIEILEILARQVVALLETRLLSQQVVKYNDVLEESRYFQHEAFHDALTGLANRNLFIEKTNLAIARSQELKNSQFAVLFIDLNRFKGVNDRFGHLAGDKLLIAVAYRLKAAVRSQDTVARLGGDEFVVLLEEIGDLNESIQIAQRIIRELQQPFEIFSKQIEIGASVGIVQGNSTYNNASELIHNADIAMYRAKAEAQDNYAIYDESMCISEALGFIA